MESGDEVKEFSMAFLDALSREAAASPRRRKNRNLHASFSEPCQRFFNAMEPDSYLRPHREALVPRTPGKLLIAVRGRFALVLFDDRGAVERIVRFAPASSRSDGWAVGAEVPPGRWNMVLSLEAGSVLLEVKEGPFDPNAPREQAPWAPVEGDASVPEFLGRMRRLVEG